MCPIIIRLADPYRLAFHYITHSLHPMYLRMCSVLRSYFCSLLLFSHVLVKMCAFELPFGRNEDDYYWQALMWMVPKTYRPTFLREIHIFYETFVSFSGLSHIYLPSGALDLNTTECQGFRHGLCMQPQSQWELS
jgi:hypothetical protein